MVKTWPDKLNKLNNAILSQQFDLGSEDWWNIYIKHGKKIAREIAKAKNVKLSFPMNVKVFTVKALLTYYRGAVNSTEEARISKKELLDIAYPHLNRMNIEMTNSVSEEEYEDCI